MWELLPPAVPSTLKLLCVLNFLYRTLVRVNAYKYAKFQVPSSISYGDMEGVQK